MRVWSTRQCIQLSTRRLAQQLVDTDATWPLETLMLPFRNVHYVHTNLIAQDWRKLAHFYETVFSCEVVPPLRDFPASAVERGTGVPGASLSGVHLRLPGYGPDGPTLEIFGYSDQLDRSRTAANRPGFAHIAFAVDDVTAVRATVLAQGGKAVGEVVTVRTNAGVEITWCYVTDPEGNIIELQSTSRLQTEGSR